MEAKLQIDKFGFRLVKVTLPVFNHKEKYLWDKCGFPLAEEWKKQKTFFLTHGWEYGLKCVGGLQVTWHFRVQLFLLPSAIAWPSFWWAFFYDPFVLVFLVSCYTFWWRGRGRTQDLVLWKDCSRTTVVQAVILRDAGEECGESSHASAHHHSRLRLPSSTLFNPPDWAKKLLKQQGNAAELKWLQGKLTGAKLHKNQQPHAVDSKFRFPANKKQYFLKKM